MEHQEILTNIRKILRSINLESKRIERLQGVSIPQFLCLSFLQNSPQYQSTVKTISGHLNLNSSTVSGIVKRLEMKGLVARLPNTQDRRGSTIALTEKGSRLIAGAPPLMHDKLGSRLAQISGEERETIRKGLDLLVQLLGLEEMDASPMLAPDGSLDGE
ncbi:MAG: MarR family transcriptional regulator [Bacteroidia bacterium]|nr:MarR family transcriptional regulator [Bacteroidia bacterium]